MAAAALVLQLGQEVDIASRTWPGIVVFVNKIAADCLLESANQKATTLGAPPPSAVHVAYG